MQIQLFKSAVLHSLSGAMLVVMGLSHLGFLRMFDIKHDLQNVVFPFLSNWSVYLLAAVIEITVGLVVIKNRRKDSANTLVLCVVVMLVWYRFAFSQAGGEACDCLGLLGRELNLSKVSERIIPKLILCFLVATTLPWLMVNLKRWIAGSANSKKASLIALSLCLFSGRVLGGQPDDKTIMISGLMTYADYNPETHKQYTNQSGSVAFSVFRGKTTYKISATNTEDPAIWSSIVYDGTNIVTFTPNAPPFFGENNSTNKVYVTISKGAIYTPSAFDYSKISALWFAFGLAPSDDYYNIPLPWEMPRNNLFAYGWSWSFSAGPGGQYIGSGAVTRDTNLDLKTQKSELLRPELEYPANLSDKNYAIDKLLYRKMFQNQWILAKYTCQKWFHTNDLYVPEYADLLIYSDWGTIRQMTNHLTSKFTILVNEVKALDYELKNLMALSENYEVADYRYKASRGKRIFEYAHYFVGSNQNWRTDADPELVQQANKFLAHGRKYDDYDQKTNFKLWVLGAVLLGPLIFMLVKQNKQRKKERE